MILQVVLGVGDGAVQHLLDDLGGGARRELAGSLRASSTDLPRMRSTTRRALRGLTRCVTCDCSGFHGSTSCLLLVGGVAAERARRRELAELVADHRLGDVHRDVLAAVVHRDRVADHLREDGRGARPGLDDLLLAGLVHRVDALEQTRLDERALLQASAHLRLSSSRYFLRRRMISRSDAFFLLRVR